MNQIAPELIEQWKESLIQKATSRMLELDGCELPYEEVEAFVRTLLKEYNGLHNEQANTNLLMNAGWFVEDGWWCNPRLKGEKVFLVNEVDKYTLSELLQIVTASAFNNGTRWMRKESSEKLRAQLSKLAKTVDKWL